MLKSKKISKSLGILLVVVLVCSIMSMSVFAYGQGGDYGIVNGDGVRLRTSMDTSSDNNVLGLLYRGERMNVTTAYPSWAYGNMSEQQKNAPDFYAEAHQMSVSNIKTKIENLKAMAATRRSGMARILSVSITQQSNTYYCGPASVKMTLDYLTGNNYSQSDLATAMGTNQTDGTLVYKIPLKLNAELGNGTYEYVSTSDVRLADSVMYSINSGKPVICNVKTGALPNYNWVSNTQHYIVTYGYNYNSQSGASVSNLYYNDPHYNNSYYGQYIATVSQMNAAINNNFGYYIMAA